jgi:hypothetical protein
MVYKVMIQFNFWAVLKDVFEGLGSLLCALILGIRVGLLPCIWVLCHVKVVSELLLLDLKGYGAYRIR